MCIVDYQSCLAKRQVAGDVTASSSTTGITVTFSSYRAATNYSSTAANDFKAASPDENRKDCTTSVLTTSVAWAGGICFFVAVCVIVYLVLTRRRSTVTTNQPERGRLRLDLLLAPHKFRIRETDTNSATLSFFLFNQPIFHEISPGPGGRSPKEESLEIMGEFHPTVSVKSTARIHPESTYATGTRLVIHGEDLHGI